MNERDTIIALAALRLLQQNKLAECFDGCGNAHIDSYGQQGAAPVTDEEIDTLYERINTDDQPLPACTCDADHDGLFYCPCYVTEPAAPAEPSTPGE